MSTPFLLRRSFATPFFNSTLSCKPRSAYLSSLLGSGLSRSAQHFRLPLTFSSQATSFPTLESSSLLKFLSNNTLRATHKSRIPQAGRVRDPFRGPPPPRGPWQRFRQRIDSLPSQVFFWGILGLNGAVYLAWYVARSNATVGGDPRLYFWMRNNFTSSMNNLQHGRIWSIVTSTMSHENTSHLLFNGFTYFFMAPAVLAILGNVGFLGLYFGGGIIANLTSLYWHNNVKLQPGYSSHGASGAIYSVISFFACVAPTTQFLLFGVVPVPAWAFVAGVFAYDGYSTVQDKQSGTDTANHIGGLLAGMGFYLRKRFLRF
ncbi:unnamed protein product [Somion occarium]|uniref:Peptidase S54 rhomboid domain-containing protein n=1 Tax=Somion occarium TaxID=3059160 RepID=A0ABP1D300_9APHY